MNIFRTMSRQCYYWSIGSNKWNPFYSIFFVIIIVVIVCKCGQHIDTTAGSTVSLESLLSSARNDSTSTTPTTTTTSSSTTIPEKHVRQHKYFHSHYHQQQQQQSKQKDRTPKYQYKYRQPVNDFMTNTKQTRQHNKRQLIIGGSEVIDPYNEYPYYAMPIINDYCGSILIHPDIIVTVAHCLDAFFIGIKIGLYNYTYYTDFIYTDNIYKIHPNYNVHTFNNDIMIIRLQRQPNTFIPLAIWNTNTNIPINNQRVRTIGFGVTNISSNTDTDDNNDELQLSTKMMQVDINVINFTSCYNSYVINNATNAPVNDTMICANDIGKDSCTGDSGGPLLQNISTYNTITNTYENTTNIVIGLVSFGEGCADIVFPGIYTRISTYSNWIYDSIYSISRFSCGNDNRPAKISEKGSYRCCNGIHCTTPYLQKILKSIKIYRPIPSTIYPNCIQCEDICISALTTRKLRRIYQQKYKNYGWLYGKCSHPDPYA